MEPGFAEVGTVINGAHSLLGFLPGLALTESAGAAAAAASLTGSV